MLLELQNVTSNRISKLEFDFKGVVYYFSLCLVSLLQVEK